MFSAPMYKSMHGMAGMFKVEEKPGEMVGTPGEVEGRRQEGSNPAAGLLSASLNRRTARALQNDLQQTTCVDVSARTDSLA